MPYYYIGGIDENRKNVGMLIYIDNPRDIKNIVSYYRIIPRRIIQLPVFFDFILETFLSFYFKVKPIELAEIFENISTMLKAGIPIVGALEEIFLSTRNKRLKYVFRNIIVEVISGGTLYNAFKKYSNVFGEQTVALIRIGEETGNLDNICRDISSYYKKIHDIQSKTKQAMIYPAFVLTAIIGALIFWMVYVLPKMVKLFEDFGVELTLTTKILIMLSEYVQLLVLPLIVTPFVSIIFLKVLRRKFIKFKGITDYVVLKLPVIGRIMYYFYFSFISEYMKVMIKSGVNISESLEILKNSINNEEFKKRISKSLEEIVNGSSMEGAFSKNSVFDSMAIKMIGIGEKTGNLENQLDFVARFYYEKLDYITQNISKMVEPIVLGVVGIFMLFMVLGLIQPIYSLISQIGNSS